MPELVVILVVALIVLGPKRLPEVARSIGRAVAEFRRQSNEVMEEFQTQLDADERKAGAAKPTAKPGADGPETHGSA